MASPRTLNVVVTGNPVSPWIDCWTLEITLTFYSAIHGVRLQYISAGQRRSTGYHPKAGSKEYPDTQVLP